MPDQTSQTLAEQIDAAAREAASLAAGKVVGDLIAARHPELPVIAWSAFQSSQGWKISGYVLGSSLAADGETHNDTVRRILDAYAKALDGTGPYVEDFATVAGPRSLRTDATVDGVTLQVWGWLIADA